MSFRNINGFSMVPKRFLNTGIFFSIFVFRHKKKLQLLDLACDVLLDLVDS